MTTTPSVRLVTAAHLPELAPDDQELLHALGRLGVATEVVVWDDPAVDWSLAPVTVIRSVFDYHLRHPEFMAWLDRIEPLTSVQNAAEIIRWNSHKSYLTRVAEAGFPIIPTEWVRQGETGDLAAILGGRGWETGVVKPAVSASAHETLMVEKADLAEGQAHLDRLAAQGDVLVQPYLHDFTTVGETSVIWLGGEQTHSVRRPSGMHTSLEVAHVGAPLAPSREELDFARAVYDWITPAPLYARVDILNTADHGLLLLELELVEPALYLRHSTSIADRFAKAVERLLHAA
ncbi:ATP-grasp domain-containing protein [Kitasatospora sp. McL0602]|uniref:ATP-grasp domain-containing protein n=1 Tax=Kitasatospora sp. McL0602 TaxID=3439530 RepID=UPI003F889B86